MNTQLQIQRLCQLDDPAFPVLGRDGVEFIRYDAQSSGFYYLKTFADGAKRPCYTGAHKRYLEHWDDILPLILKQSKATQGLIIGHLKYVVAEDSHRFASEVTYVDLTLASPAQYSKAVLKAFHLWEGVPEPEVANA
jgi:hypothetical protein